MAPPAASPDTPESRALATLSLLQLRLQRLEFLLTGLNSIASEPTASSATQQTTAARETIPASLHSLEQQLASLKRLEGLGGSLVRAVDDLHTRVPELFPTSEDLHTVAKPEPREASRASTQQLSQLASEVLACAPLYTTTTSQLQTLQHIPVPPARASADLIQQHERVKGLLERLERAEAENRELKERSARTMEWWVKVGVVGWGEVLQGWEDRITRAGWVVRGMERRRAEEKVLAA